MVTSSAGPFGKCDAAPSGHSRRAISCPDTRPSDVNWSTACGKYWLRFWSKSSRDMPDCDISALIFSAPRVLARSFGDICLLGPVPTHELTVLALTILLKLFEQVDQAAVRYYKFFALELLRAPKGIATRQST